MQKPESALDDDEVAVKDGSGYYAAMFTGQDFGCIHHEIALTPEPASDNNSGG